MTINSRRYAKLLKAQKLVKARDEANLENLRVERETIAQEDWFLLSLMGQDSMTDHFDPTLVARRLQRNARHGVVLDDEISKQRQSLLQSSRRCDIIDGKYKIAIEAEERKEMSNMLEEYVATKIVKHSSLG